MPKYEVQINTTSTVITSKKVIVEAPNQQGVLAWAHGKLLPSETLISLGIADQRVPWDLEVTCGGSVIARRQSATPPPATPAQFRPGQTVRCVKGTRHSGLLVAGRRYTIGAVVKAGSVDHKGRTTENDTVILIGNGPTPIMWDQARFTDAS